MGIKQVLVEQTKNRDQFRIVFHCYNLPEVGSRLIGFEANKIYTGRFYNSLYEISVDWGRSKPYIIEKRQFEKYFRRIDKENPTQF